MSLYHIPVMLREVIKYLDVKPNNWYIDCSLGGGGHTEGILKAGGKVLGIDLDPDAISEVTKNHNLELLKDEDHLYAVSSNLIIYQDNFANIDSVIARMKTKQSLKSLSISGILFDLGVSSHQLEEAERGFSFNLDAPLDMRMDKSSSVTAADLVNGLHEGELSELLWKLGEERFAKKIAKKIVEVRTSKKIETTLELAKIISSVYPRTLGNKVHPATRVFQALRIAVNDELNSLKEALPKAFEVLSPGGRLAVISFHSLEDRIVKNYFRLLSHHERSSEGSQDLKPFAKILTDKPLESSEEEIFTNPRARSGKLRVVEKIA